MDVAGQVRKIYEKRPYPPVKSGRTPRLPWLIAPMEWIQAVAQPIPAAPERILVAGCGTGAEAFALARRFPRAKITAVDFSPRSIRQARVLQRRSPSSRRIHFTVGDLAARGFSKKAGGPFDFISCHGVLSYIPKPVRALRNLASCLTADGMLYLGVNGAEHISVFFRKLLPEFGFDVAELQDGPFLRGLLTLYDTILEDTPIYPVAKSSAGYLAGDVFGPLIQNLPLADWVTMAKSAGLHFADSYSTRHALRRAVQHETWRLLIPRSRAEVCQVVETLLPSGFYRLVFTRRSVANPPWAKHNALLDWRPALTNVFRCSLPRRSRSWQTMRSLVMKSSATNTRLDWQIPEWGVEILRRSNGERTLREILEGIRVAVSPDLLRDQLYRLYHLMVINLLPGS